MPRLQGYHGHISGLMLGITASDANITMRDVNAIADQLMNAAGGETELNFTVSTDDAMGVTVRVAVLVFLQAE